MSAFVVNYGVIDDVVFIMNKDPDDQPPRSDEQRIADGTRLGKRLLAMNIEAVTQRYDLKPGSEESRMYALLIDKYRYVEPNGVPGMQKFKSIGCFTYQCMEGDIPETWDLYKQVSNFEEMLGRVFEIGSPAYNKAKWDRTR